MTTQEIWEKEFAALKMRYFTTASDGKLIFDDHFRSAERCLMDIEDLLRRVRVEAKAEAFKEAAEMVRLCPSPQRAPIDIPTECEHEARTIYRIDAMDALLSRAEEVENP